jgi:hypothetical protein
VLRSQSRVVPHYLGGAGAYRNAAPASIQHREVFKNGQNLKNFFFPIHIYNILNYKKSEKSQPINVGLC